MGKRRGQGEGSIYKLSDGRWCGAVSLGWQKGEAGQPVWKRRIIYGASRNEVQQKLTAILRFATSFATKTTPKGINRGLSD